MKLTQYERDNIISQLEKAWKYEFQSSLVITLVSRVDEVTKYPSWSPYIYQPKTPALLRRIEYDMNEILNKWARDKIEQYPSLEILNDRSIFWIRVEEHPIDPCALMIVFSPEILLLGNGQSEINVFDWSKWTDDTLKNNYDDLVKKGRI